MWDFEDNQDVGSEAAIHSKRVRNSSLVEVLRRKMSGAERATETKESSNRLVEEHCMRKKQYQKGWDCMEERMPE